jgi:hypothetical protein
MTTILDKEIRNGNFSSSEIVALTKFGSRDMTKEELANRPKTGEGSSSKKIEDETVLSDAAITYINECNMERASGKSVDSDSSQAWATSWGNLCERRAFDVLDMDYTLMSKQTLVHPLYDYWVGTPDARKEQTSGDIKCPYTLKSFIALVEPIYMGFSGDQAMHALRNGYVNKKGLKIKKHDDAEKFYWQIVSNARLLEANGIVENCDFGELIVYCPFESELDDVRAICGLIDDPLEQRNYYWVNQAMNEDLPHIKDGGFYKNLNVIRFSIPKADKAFLERMVKNAGKYLIDRV